MEGGPALVVNEPSETETELSYVRHQSHDQARYHYGPDQSSPLQDSLIPFLRIAPDENHQRVALN
jgi:hypothetical protein